MRFESARPRETDSEERVQSVEDKTDMAEDDEEEHKERNRDERWEEVERTGTTETRTGIVADAARLRAEI